MEVPFPTEQASFLRDENADQDNYLSTRVEGCNESRCTFELHPVTCNRNFYFGGEEINSTININSTGQSTSFEINIQNSSEEQREDYSLLSYFNRDGYVRIFLDAIMKRNTKKIFSKLLKIVFAVLYLIYFAAVLLLIDSKKTESGDFWCNSEGFLIIITATFSVGFLYFEIFKPTVGRFVVKFLKRLHAESLPIQKVQKTINNRYFSIFIYGSAIILWGVFLYIDTKEDRSRLISACGILVFCLVGFLFSTAPRKIIWRHVIWGIGLQFLLGFLVLRTRIGQDIFKCLGDKVNSFIKFTDFGSSFLFGKLVSEMDILAFKVLPIILFFSFCIQILYYYGVMQWIVKKLGWLLHVTIGTTAGESVCAAANIFIGISEAPLVIKPYLSDMTTSELHAVMTGGFATIAGSMLALYVSFGVDSKYLLSASVMSAPAALGVSKLFCPEIEVSKVKIEDIKFTKRVHSNVLHAAIEGLYGAIPIVASISVSLIAFISFIAFANEVFNWFCVMVNIEDGVCNISTVMGYAFMPIALIMGVPWDECYYVGQLIGLKTIINEFVGYVKLSEYVTDNLISKRSEILSTYALCGFSNITAIGIQIAALGSMLPERKRDITKVAFRAMVAGSVACFMTACVAGTIIHSNEEEEKDLTNNQRRY